MSIKRAVKKTIKKRVVSTVKFFPPLRRAVRLATISKRRRKYMMIAKDIMPDSKIIIFESFMGRSFGDSPKAIYEEMLQSEKFSDCKFIWAFKKPNEICLVCNSTLAKAKLIKYGSSEYYESYASAGIWISNSRLPEYLQPKPEQKYIQTWHGTTLKKLGYDIDVEGGNAMNTKQELHEKYDADAERYTALISPSPYMTDIYRSMFNLKDHPNADIWELGYPRNDRLINATEQEISYLKMRFDIHDDKKVILYAPTWRDNQHTSGVGYTYENPVDFDLLREKLGEEYIILFRAHYFVANNFDFEKYDGFVRDVSKVSDINDLYLISDILITDYSSVFFDFAILQRPIFFFMYDLEDYKDKLRGFYLKLEDLPGPVVMTETELASSIKNSQDSTYQFDEFNKKFNPYEDGESSRRVVERICNVINI